MSVEPAQPEESSRATAFIFTVMLVESKTVIGKSMGNSCDFLSKIGFIVLLGFLRMPIHNKYPNSQSQSKCRPIEYQIVITAGQQVGKVEVVGTSLRRVSS